MYVMAVAAFDGFAGSSLDRRQDLALVTATSGGSPPFDFRGATTPSASPAVASAVPDWLMKQCELQLASIPTTLPLSSSGIIVVWKKARHGGGRSWRNEGRRCENSNEVRERRTRRNAKSKSFLVSPVVHCYVESVIYVSVTFQKISLSCGTVYDGLHFLCCRRAGPLAFASSSTMSHEARSTDSQICHYSRVKGPAISFRTRQPP
jgi:hypothetical protein